MMGISPLIIEKWDTGTANQAAQYLAECRRMGRAAALLIPAGVFDDRLPSSLGEGQNQYPPRAKIIDTILNYVAPKDFVIAGIGHTGRQLYGSRLKREATNDELLQDFLCVGGMGYALQVAIGAGLRHTDGRIWCIEGDGSFLMHLGTAATIRKLGDFALICILLDNGAHASVGGQRTASVSLDYAAAADALGFRSTEEVSSVGELNTAIPKLLERVGPHFLWSKIANEPDIVLPRPNESFGDRKSAVMKLLRAQS
jgi:phosphonopyruvate decarboxylase